MFHRMRTCEVATTFGMRKRRGAGPGVVRQALRVNSIDRRLFSSPGPGVARSGCTAVRPFSEQGVVLGGTVVRLAGALGKRPGTTRSVRVGSDVSNPRSYFNADPGQGGSSSQG